jgi:hypothetical protein
MDQRSGSGIQREIIFRDTPGEAAALPPVFELRAKFLPFAGKAAQNGEIFILYVFRSGLPLRPENRKIHCE